MDVLSVLSLGFLIVLILLGGIIAFLADRLGRYLGKRRLRLGGLRPRHTAEVLTVSAGVLIPFLTIVVVLGASSDMRRILFEGGRAIQEAERAKKEARTLKEERDRIAREVDLRQNQISELETKTAQLQEAATRFQEKAANAESRVTALGAQIHRLESTMRVTRARLAKATEELIVKSRERDQLNSSFQQIRRQRDELFREYNVLQDDLEDLRANVLALKATIEGLQQEKSKTESDLSAARQQLADTQRRLGDTQRMLEETQASLDYNRRQLEEAGRLLAQAIALIEGPGVTSRYQPLVFARGEELARLPVESRLTEEQARLHLTRLLRAARVEAEAKGSVSIPGVPAAAIVPIRDERGNAVTVEAQEREILRGITGRDEPLVLVALSRYNSFAGEPVALEIRWFRNPVVFAAGELIAEGRVDGRQPLGQILEQISELLTTRVRERAREAGMVPFAGKPQSFGEVPSAAVLEIVDQIKQADRVVRLQVLARSETLAGDALELEFRIR